MATPEIPCAASSLLTGLVDGAERELVEVARTRVSVHYETGDAAVPVLSLCTPSAVRLPNSVVASLLPGAGDATVGGGGVHASVGAWRVHRWWRPPRPAGLPLPHPAHLLACAPPPPALGVTVPRPAYDGLSPAALVGAGPGLTPAGDDVLAGALVAAYATGDPRLGAWRRATRATLTAARTTAVSRAMLHHALDGYATAQLAGFLTALCLGHDLTRPRADLLAVGHTSGGALLAGVLHTLSTHHIEGAA